MFSVFMDVLQSACHPERTREGIFSIEVEASAFLSMTVEAARSPVSIHPSIQTD
jgi:hypothetical protein